MIEPSTSASTGSGQTVVVTQRIAAPLEAVFPFLVKPDLMRRWLGTEARLDATPGGEFWVVVDDADTAVGKFTEIDPPRRIAFTWGWEGNVDVPPGSTTVTIDLTADGDGTIVELRHDGLVGELAARHEEGWSRFLPILAAAF